MKYYYVIFDHDCSSNAFSDNPYLFEQYIKERKDIIATSTINLTGDFEADDYGTVIRILSQKMGSNISWESDIQYVADPISGDIVTFTDNEVDRIGFDVFSTMTCIIDEVSSMLKWFRELIDTGIIHIGTGKDSNPVDRASALFEWYRALALQLDWIGIDKLDSEAIKQLFTNTGREDILHMLQNNKASIVEIGNLFICYRDYFLPAINDVLPFEED